MKLAKLIGVAAMATTLGMISTTIKPDMAVQAKTIKSLTSIPKTLRGTWYYYGGKYDKHYYYQKITAKKLKNHDPYRTETNTIHKFTLSKKSKSHNNLNNWKYGDKHHWLYAYKQGKKYYMDAWVIYATAVYSSDRPSYEVTKRNYKGKQVKVLKIHPRGSSKGAWKIYSPSKKIAKYLYEH